MCRAYEFTADLRVKGYVYCKPENFQEAVEQAIEDGEFDFTIAGVDWYELEDFEEE